MKRSWLATSREDDVRQLLHEHDQLRKEILHNDVVNMQIMTAVFTLNAAITAAAFSQFVSDNRLRAILFLGAAIIVMIGLLQTTERGRQTFLIASYLRVFVESQLPFVRWETRLRLTRGLALTPARRYLAVYGAVKKCNKLFDSSRRVYPLLCLIDVLIAIGFLLPYAVPGSPIMTGIESTKFIYEAILAVSVLSIGALFFCSVGIYESTTRKYGEPFNERWRDIRRAEMKRIQLRRAQLSRRTAAHHKGQASATPIREVIR